MASELRLGLIKVTDMLKAGGRGRRGRALETCFYYNVEFLPRACLCTLELQGPQSSFGLTELILGEGKRLLGGLTCLCQVKKE